MGVNVMFNLEVRGLADEAQTKAVLDSLVELIASEGLTDQGVGLGWSVEDGKHWISGETDFPIGISRMYAWRPRFETDFRERVLALAPAATATINWRYPDEE